MKTLTVEDRLSFARATAAVLRSLSVTDRTMRYKELAVAIGLMRADDKWEVWHRNQITEILNRAMHLTQVAQAVVVRPWLIIPARCWSFAIGS